MSWQTGLGSKEEEDPIDPQRTVRGSLDEVDVKCWLPPSSMMDRSVGNIPISIICVIFLITSDELQPN